MEELLKEALLAMMLEHAPNRNPKSFTKDNAAICLSSMSMDAIVAELAAKLLAKGVQLPTQSGYANGVEPYDIPGDLD